MVENLQFPHGPNRKVALRCDPYKSGNKYYLMQKECAIIQERAFLEVELRRYDSTGFVREMYLQQKRLDRYTVELFTIVPDTLPTLDNLEVWSRNNMMAGSTRFPASLDCVIDRFLEAYCNVSPPLPMASYRD